MEDIEESFYPYKNKLPAFNGLSTGMTISATNADQFKDIIDTELYKHITDGSFEIKVGQTTSFDLHPNYITATREGLGKVSLGNRVGQIRGYEAGRPFPAAPKQSDPRAGEKLAWNFRFGYRGDNAGLFPIYSKYRDIKKNKIERTLKSHHHVINFKHRVTHSPIPEIVPNPSGLYYATYLHVMEPYDVKNTQLLIHRADDDLKRDNAWMYLGFQRRVRRLATGQTTDAFLGSDYMIEDFEGYNGRICDMKWTFIATRFVLLPFYNHNELALDMETHNNDPDGFNVVAFEGKGNCYPTITWQLRKAYEIEATPVDPNHPIGKRVHFMDAQTFALPRTNIYDRAGNLWKIFIIGLSHPDYHLSINKRAGVALVDSASMIDVQADHCTTGQFKCVVDPRLCPASKFTVQHLRTSGR